MTTEQVRQKLLDHNVSWDQFAKWMEGQTVGVYPDGSTDWYDYDVHRFIRHTLQRSKENSAEWD